MRILWFTNQMAPYRAASWEVLSHEADLLVAKLGRRQRHRPAWRRPSFASFEEREIRPLHASMDSDSPLARIVNPWAVRQLVSEVCPDAVVVAAWGDLAALEATVIIRRSGVPLVGFYGTSASTRRASQLIGTLRRRHLRTFDAILSYGSETTRLMIGEDGIDPQRIVTGFNTVDTKQLATAVGRCAPRPVGGGHRFLFVGQLVHRKGADIAVRALAQTPSLVDATLTIAGAGPELAPLSDLVRVLGMGDRVRFTGLVEVDQVPALYASHHTLVMPSHREVWGLVANEALASGMHAVLSVTAGCAPDLAAYRGVYLAMPQPLSVAHAMERSAADWSGPVPEPAIRGIGASHLADDIFRAAALAVAGART